MRGQTMKKLLLGAVSLASSLALLAAGCGSGPSPTGPRVAFDVQPGTTITGELISPAVLVVVQDAQGNTLMSASPTITLGLGTNPGGGSLWGLSTGLAASGAATFSDLSIDKPGRGYTLTAAAPGLTGNTSSPFDVTGEPVATVTVAPGSADAGSAGNTVELTAMVQDAAGQVLADRKVTWRSSDERVAIVAFWNGLTTTDGGVVQAWVCGLSPGSATITATSGYKSGTALVTVIDGSPTTVDGC
jgi:hypothetical protein